MNNFRSIALKSLIAFSLFCPITVTPLHPLQADYVRLKSGAERLYAEGSYALARELYSKADAVNLPAEERRWVDFRLADTLWRSQAGTQTTDSTKYDEARRQLEALTRDVQRVEDRDRVWAEVQESLGDFWWTRRDSRSWGQAWPYYQQALDWWAGAPDIELARERYLKIVWTLAKPSSVEPYYYYGYYGNVVPLEVLENALQIAKSEADRAHAHYLIAMTTRQQGGDWEQRQRVPEEFEAALKPGKVTGWYDDALYHYAEWLADQGRSTPLDDGQWRQEPDYAKALELFGRLVSEHDKGGTRYYDQARQQIEAITMPAVGVMVPQIFLPGSEVQFHLNWRNLKRISLALYRVDLTRDVQLSGENAGTGNWLQSIDLSRLANMKAWFKETEDRGDHKPSQEILRLPDKLPMGAYVIEARGEGKSARDLILVTDASLVLKTSGKQALLYFCDALSGSPLPKAKLTLWERSYNGQRWVWRENTKETNPEGVSVFDLTDTRNNVELFVAAASGDRQAFSTGSTYGTYSDPQPWRIYAFTDRPAYRPKEEVRWKFVARKYNGSVYSTPAQQNIEFEINDPRGTKIKEDRVTLNSFGSAWGSLELGESMPLGEYHVTFWDESRKNHIGSATLFRLEEYKVPEFKVSIQTPEAEGKKKAFRLGEKVEVIIQADYYFGGPIANAIVEVLVYQNPFYLTWQPPHDFPWLYKDMSLPNWYSWDGQDQVTKRETLKTDATGKLTFTFDTPRNAQQDFEYRIEARVTDASRREIISSNTVRVTRQRYYVYPRPEHNLYRPQDKVSVDLKALDANGQPVQAEGKIRVTRDYWYEVWQDPSGKEVKGEELRGLREKSGVFPPSPAGSGSKPWQLKFRGYQQEDVLTRIVRTNPQGEAELTFTPEREGYYRIAWSSQDNGRAPIKAETAVWVARNTTTELGYRHGGLEIILDKDTFHAGQKAAVMLVAPTEDRYVLFSLEGEDLYSYQLVHLTGTTKLVELEVQQKHAPNIFLSAAMVSDRQFFVDTKQVVVPPIDHFLAVEVKSDREQYQPREQGTLLVTTRDQNGNPVAAEVALGLVDESVYYIQQDYAGDPREFYYGTKRQHRMQMMSTLNLKPYAKLVEGADQQLIDERDFELRKKQRADSDNFKDDIAAVSPGEADGIGAGVSGGVARGVPGGVAAGVVGGVRKSASVLRAEKKESETSNREAANMAVDEAAAAPAPPGQEPAVQVRSDFRSTVLWQPDVVTDRDGKATVRVKYPDSLTSWKATARVVTAHNQFGLASAGVRTHQPLIVRLQAPRFFVVGDKVTLSAVINNNTDKTMLVSASLLSEGPISTVLVSDGKPAKNEPGPMTVPAHGEARSDWVATVQKPGSVRLKVTARNEKYADGMEKEYMIYEHGIEKFISKSGKVRGDDVTIRLHIPERAQARIYHFNRTSHA
jgi:alpha-2-macroglobulin